jgi:two-component system, LuxR family, sensor kinase FixL
VTERISHTLADVAADRGLSSQPQDSQRLAAIVESSFDAIIGKSLDGTITDWNPSAQRIFGYSAQEAVGKPITILIPRDRLAEEADILARIRRGECIDHFETERITRDGRLINVSVSISPIRDQAGRIIGASKIARDITGQRQATTALLDSEQRLRAIVENAVDGIIAIDRHGIVATMNPAAIRMFGYEPHEVIGKNVKILMPSPYREQHDDYLKNYLTTGIKKIIGIGREVTGRRKDGTVFPIDLSVSEFVLGQGRMFTGIIHDISDRKAAEEATRQSEERYRTLFESMSEGFCLCELICDKDGNPEDFVFLAVNPAYAKIAGRKSDELVGKRATEIFPGMESYWVDALAKPALTGQTIRYTNYAKELDRYFDVYAFGPSKGKFAALTMDVTDRQRAKDALARQAEVLARSNVELERFAHIASHDLQEPLRTVSSFAKLLERRHALGLAQEAREYLQFITNGVERMESLIRDLLSYSRVDSRGTAFTAVDCAAIFEKVRNSLKASIDAVGATVTVDSLPTVMGDPTQLGQVFQNLLTNAIKFRRENPPTIHVSARQMPDEWVFSVRDNGIGIDKEYFDRIFIIFQRLHTMEEYSGTGIGLAVCKKIMERHHGKIWLESTVGQGTTFYFSIPRKGDRR